MIANICKLWKVLWKNVQDYPSENAKLIWSPKQNYLLYWHLYTDLYIQCMGIVLYMASIKICKIMLAVLPGDCKDAFSYL